MYIYIYIYIYISNIKGPKTDLYGTPAITGNHLSLIIRQSLTSVDIYYSESSLTFNTKPDMSIGFLLIDPLCNTLVKYFKCI